MISLLFYLLHIPPLLTHLTGYWLDTLDPSSILDFSASALPHSLPTLTLLNYILLLYKSRCNA
jgi:hypothetical protein